MSADKEILVPVPMTKNDIALVMRRELETALAPLMARIKELETRLDGLNKKNKTTE